MQKTPRSDNNASSALGLFNLEWFFTFLLLLEPIAMACFFLMFNDEIKTPGATKQVAFWKTAKRFFCCCERRKEIVNSIPIFGMAGWRWKAAKGAGRLMGTQQKTSIRSERLMVGWWCWCPTIAIVMATKGVLITIFVLESSFNSGGSHHNVARFHAGLATTRGPKKTTKISTFYNFSFRHHHRHRRLDEFFRFIT